MATVITTIEGTDVIANSRTDINANFASLNTNKIETSTLDTDTSLTANSDSKIATQKAVKAYVDSGGQPFASETQAGRVQEATDAQVAAGTATGSSGAKLFITPAKLATASGETGVSKLIKTKSTGLLDSSILPDTGSPYKLGAGSSTDSTYENYIIEYGIANTVYAWTSVGSPTYKNNHLVVGSAQGVYRTMPIDLQTGAAYTFETNTKKIIMQWSMKIIADTSTATATMGFSSSTTSDFNPAGGDRYICFGTNTSGAWFATTAKDSTHYTATAIATPSAGVHTFRIEYNPATPSALFYIDGVLVATNNTAANFPNQPGAYNMVFVNGTSSTIINVLGGINMSIQK